MRLKRGNVSEQAPATKVSTCLVCKAGQAIKSRSICKMLQGSLRHMAAGSCVASLNRFYLEEGAPTCLIIPHPAFYECYLKKKGRQSGLVAGDCKYHSTLNPSKVLANPDPTAPADQVTREISLSHGRYRLWLCTIRRGCRSWLW